MKWDDLTVGKTYLVTESSRRSVKEGTLVTIVSISLPFALVEIVGDDKYSMDLREHELVRTHPAYIRAYKAANAEMEAPRKKKKSKAATTVASPDPRMCPICGGPIIERLDNKTRLWYKTCKDCRDSGLNPRTTPGG